MTQAKVSHRRHNPLLDEWILVSPHRVSRPWQGHHEKNTEERPQYDEACYLCPGNTRVTGAKNPAYTNTFVFPNDFQALLSESSYSQEKETLFRGEPVEGSCKVICFSPRHDLSLAEMSIEDITSVITIWKEQLRELGKEYLWVQIFENKGAVMGSSNMHPHGQIWASTVLPTLVAKEDTNQEQYFKQHNESMLCTYAQKELEKKERVVYENEQWVVVIPYWATWPFETIVLPKFPAQRLLDIKQEEYLSDAIKNILVKYDNLFETSFSYSMGLHGAPLDGKEYPYWQFHLHFYPPLLRSATVKKFMVGYEMLAESQRDLTPEDAAKQLREMSLKHFKEK